MTSTSTTTLALRDKDDRTRARRLTKWQQKFLRVLRQTPSVKHACSASGVSRQTAYRHRETNPQFAKRWTEAIEHSVDDLEAKAFALALSGDGSLIQWLLRCHKPQLYKERSEVGIVGGVALVPMKMPGPE